MALKNFKEFRVIETEIDYGGCADAVKTYPSGSPVELHSWNKSGDVVENPTSSVEKDFLARKPLRIKNECIVYYGKVKINGKWEECILSEWEVPIHIGCSYLNFEVVERVGKQIAYSVDRNGKKVVGEEREKDYSEVMGVDFTYYNSACEPCYNDFVEFSAEDLKDGVEKAVKEVIDEELRYFGRGNLKIGKPPKKN